MSASAFQPFFTTLHSTGTPPPTAEIIFAALHCQHAFWEHHPNNDGMNDQHPYGSRHQQHSGGPRGQVYANPQEPFEPTARTSDVDIADDSTSGPELWHEGQSSSVRTIVCVGTIIGVIALVAVGTWFLVAACSGDGTTFCN